MTVTGLTKREAEALAFIGDYSVEHGCAPNYDEIKDYLQVASKSNVHRLVTALERRGHLVRVPHSARSVALANQFPDPYNDFALHHLTDAKLSDLIVAAGAILAQRRKGRAAA